jgi:hypothetical protein
MCKGNTEAELVADFKRRVGEREFPTCPPEKIDLDGRISFKNSQKLEEHQREFHHAALFGLTRWTNLYFPMKQLFWGDAIGGPLADIFGANIKEVKTNENVETNSATYEFFTHTAYWDTNRSGGRAAPHIEKLIQAVNLADLDEPINSLVD